MENKVGDDGEERKNQTQMSSYDAKMVGGGCGCLLLYEVSELGELMPWLGSGWNRGESGARARTTADACGQALGAFDRTAECLFFGEPSTASLVI
jgi:hypothetical protein